MYNYYTDLKRKNEEKKKAEELKKEEEINKRRKSIYNININRKNDKNVE